MLTTSPPPPEAVVIMDRFVSASSSQDAIVSLEQIVAAFKNANNGTLDGEREDITWQPAWIFENEKVVENLVWLLQNGTLRANESPCEEGVHLVCQLYHQLINSSEILMKPSPGILIESLLDILDNQEHPVYVRVLALRVLEDLSKGHKSIAVAQWLQAPNGLYRISDLIAIDVENNPMKEPIRNQALIVAKSLAHEAPMAKVFLFAEVDCKLLDLCWKEGGLTKGSPIVIDALELIQEVLKHADKSLQDLVWQRPNVAPRLIQLLDLRGGDEFLHPKEKSVQTLNVGDVNDDLDSILASGEGKSNKEKQVEDAPIPHLLPSEEKVVRLVLNILRLLLEIDSVKEMVWTQQPGLCSIIWELALVSNPSIPPVCALPSPSLQQEALTLVADKFNNPLTMNGLSGLDRLLYLVCTGGRISVTFEEKLGISQSSLAVLRQSLSDTRIHDILMRTLAPPPMEDESIPQIGPTVVQKLWNTVQENYSAQVSEERTLFLSGSLGGLGLMLCDEESREIMFKVAPISINQISESLSYENDSFVKCSLLRFLCEWIYECPSIAHNLLSSAASTNLAGMATTPSDCQSLVHLLLGLAMVNMTNEEDCGGWTRNGIFQIIMKIGISKFSSSLERMKTTPNQKMPWIVSEMESTTWRKFCRQAVLVVRKCVVEELAAGSGDSDDDSENKDSGSGPDSSLPTNQGIKPLQKLVSQQAKEIEQMTIRLESAEIKVSSQENQLSTWRRRMKSTPSELDDMLSEFTSKNSDLKDKVRLLEREIERQKSAKNEEIKRNQDKLLKCEAQANLLRSQEQEVRDDLERTEQEMKALSQAYTSLEDEYQRQQDKTFSGAQSSEISQQLESKASHEQNGAGSTELTTLRSENLRLKNDARKADEWMSMAVEKMNQMGSSNKELEKQLSLLNNKIEESSAVADRMYLENQSGAQLRQSLEAELKNEKALRLAAEERLLNLDDLRTKLDQEEQKSKNLQNHIADTEQKLLNYQNIESKMQTEQHRLEELESRVFEAEEATKMSKRELELETGARIKIERQLATNNPNKQLSQKTGHDSEKLEELRAEYDKVVDAKNVEIDDLKYRLLRGEDESKNKHEDKENSNDSSQTVDEIRQSSQENIYRLESIIRELKDRLDSGLGGYKVEDIMARDGEIEELQKANESAQEWMSKAVEHHNMYSDQIKNLANENKSLLARLQEERKGQISTDMSTHPSTNHEDTQKSLEYDLMRKDFAVLEAELERLKGERDANKGLLDELGIAMDDVAVMQEQLTEYKLIKSELEKKLSENAFSDENEDLKSSNEDLQKKLNEFEDWAQVAQTKIGDIMIAKDESESRLQEITRQVDSLQKENGALKSMNTDLLDKERVLKRLREGIENLTSINDHLLNEKNDLQLKHDDLQSQHDTLVESFNHMERELSSSSIQKNTIEKCLVEEQQLSSIQSAQIDELKSKNIELLDSIKKSALKSYTAQDLVADIATPKNTVGAVAQSSDALDVQAEEHVAMSSETQTDRYNAIVEELERTRTELAAAKEGLSLEEEVLRDWEERTAQMKFELANSHQRMEEQENEAVNAIQKWQQNAVELEEKNAELGGNLKHALESKDSQHIMNNKLNCELSQLKEENIVLQNKVDRIEESLSGSSDSPFDSERQHVDTIEELQVALKIAQNTIAEDDEIVRQWEERTSQLELKVKSFESELRESEIQANEVISEWQNKCATVELKYDSVEEELEAVKQAQEISCSEKSIDEVAKMKTGEMLAQKEEELQRLKLEIEARSQSLQKQNDDVLALKRKLQSMTEDLVNQEVEAKKSIEQLNEKLDASCKEKRKVEIDLENCKSALSDLKQRYENFDHDDQIVIRLEDKIRELSGSVEMLEGQLREQGKEAFDAVEQWQLACSDLETKCANLERVESSLRGTLTSVKMETASLVESHEVEHTKWTDQQLKLEAKVEAEKEKYGEAMDEIKMLSSSLEGAKMNFSNTLTEWKVRYEELKSILVDAQQQLEEQESEANEAISIWEIKSDELEKELDVAEDRLLHFEKIFTDNSIGIQEGLVVATENLLRENTNINTEVKKMMISTEKNISQMRYLESKNTDLEESLATKRERMKEIETENEKLSNQLSLKSEDKLEEERDRLIGVVAQLEEELREANSILQACVTDGSTDKASEFAANAIRDDINNMKNKLKEYQQMFEHEKAAKEVADLEIERLRNDIAALLCLSDHEKSPTNMKKLTTKSIEKLQKLEHTEINALRKSLYRALEEIDLIRSTECNANESVSRLQLQISIYEQEIIAAKSEVNFLSAAMEELRQNEDSKRASLEYRMGSLENENDVVRKYQSNELESLRNELAQITMEKDLVIHQLKESEKTNASLVLATSKEQNSNEEQTSDIHSECVKLRIENAHLLTIAADDKSKAERQLRELLSAQVASTELDVILEHELRISAETALQTLKEEISELRNGKHFEKVLETSDNATGKELQDLRTSYDNLMEENVRLKTTMDEDAVKTKQKIDLLTDECRRAQSKAFKADRDARIELAVQSEVSKMRISNVALPSDKLSLYDDLIHNKNDSSVTNGCDSNVSSAVAFDLIKKQQKEIQEERLMYSETLQEHEHLLALVAQQDLEKICLREALIEVAGDDVANDAIKRAEEFAVIRYGNVVQVSN